MPRTPKKDYEPVSQEKWIAFKDREYDSDDKVANRDNKRDLHRQVLKLNAKICLGDGFRREFQDRRDTLRSGGKSLTEAYRTAILEFARRIPTHEALVEDGTYRAFEQKRLAHQRYKEDREVEKRVSLTRLELHEELAGKRAKIEDVDWVAEHLFAGLDVLTLDPEDIPSRMALNMLESANNNKPDFWSGYRKELVLRAAKRTSLSDSGRGHVEVMQELFAEKAVFDGMMETADVAVGT